jgi:hypothetical protein
MNTSTQLLICGFVLFVVIFISLSSVPVVSPYSKPSLFSKEFPYEGFAGVADAAVIVNPAVPATGTTGPGPVLVSGFSGLQTSPAAKETPLDLYSELPTGGKCEPSPYSNSQGYLCLDKNASMMLSTRGANATGKDVQIGH